MKDAKRIFGLGLLVLVISIFTVCGNILDSHTVTNDSGKDGLVRIYLGAQSTGARTVQPGHTTLSGYRLTFAGASNTQRDPVDINGADYADVYLIDGTWTITAKAYKSGGTIGEESDKIAEGNINVTLSGGAVQGAVSPIILRSSAVGNGTLHYSITLPSGVTGSLKLWDINDVAVSGFGTNGVLTFAASLTGDYTLAAGRYIAEVNLTNHTGGGVGFRREVVEIWADTASDFVLAPEEFLDPNGGLMEEGIYIGILSFDRVTNEIATPILLNSTSRATLINKMDTEYARSADSDTLLYYSVHKALNSILDMESRLPDNTQSINIITFTDGVDVGSISPILWNNSPLAGFDFREDVTGDEYLTWIHGQLTSTRVKNNSITASAYGVAGEDVTSSNAALFERNISSLATESGEHSTSIRFSDLSDKFGEIAANLNTSKTNTSFNLLLTPPSGGNGTVFKMTFDDIQDADSSTEWFTGEYRYSSGTYTLSNLQYAGIASGEGYPSLPTSLIGMVVGTQIQYHFDSLNLSSIPLTERNNVQQWFKNPGASDWQHLTEYDKGNAASSTTKQSTAVIYLILDSSRSLSEANASEIRKAAKDFINAVYQKYEEKITYTVTVANAITGGTVSARPTSGSSGTTITLDRIPDSDYSFGGFTVNGKPISGNSFTLNGNVVVGGVFSGGTPSTPSGVTASAQSSSSISVSWSSVSGATGYKVYRSTSASGTYTQVGSPMGASYTDSSGLSPNTTYYYKVSAVNSAGTSSQSTYTSATTSSSSYDDEKKDEGYAPSAPTGVTAYAYPSNVYLYWNLVYEASHYYIYRSNSAYGTYSWVEETTGTSYYDYELSPNTTYYYKIIAVNGAGESNFSSYTSVTTSSDY